MSHLPTSSASAIARTLLPSIPATKYSPKGRSTRDLMASDGKRVAHKITDEQFDHFIMLVADGVRPRLALETVKVTRTAIEDVLRGNDAARARYEEAKLRALYKELDLETVENVLAELALGKQPLTEILEDRFISPNIWWKLVVKDPLIKELYDEARQIQAEMQADELMRIAGNESRDIVESDGEFGIERKANNAAVQRDRLKSDNLKWRMARLHHERFGDKQKIDLNANVTVDYANRLEQARNRKQAAIIKPKEAP